jgi:hypothetical protein
MYKSIVMEIKSEGILSQLIKENPSPAQCSLFKYFESYNTKIKLVKYLSQHSPKETSEINWSYLHLIHTDPICLFTGSFIGAKKKKKKNYRFIKSMRIRTLEIIFLPITR